MRGKSPGADGDGDSLLSSAKFAVGTVSSILRESDLKRSGALLVVEALALSFQGVAFVSSGVSLRFFFGFELHIDFKSGIGRWLLT